VHGFKEPAYQNIFGVIEGQKESWRKSFLIEAVSYENATQVSEELLEFVIDYKLEKLGSCEDIKRVKQGIQEILFGMLDKQSTGQRKKFNAMMFNKGESGKILFAETLWLFYMRYSDLLCFERGSVL